MWHAHLARDSRAGRPCHSVKLRHYLIAGPVDNLRRVRFESLLSAKFALGPSLGKESYPMLNRTAIITWLAAAFIVCLLSQRTAMSQSTILNVPSSDVVSAKKLYAEFDFITNYAWERHGSFQNYLPRAVLGVGHSVEVGANVSYTHVSGESQPLEIQPNIKWRFYSNEANGTAAAVGCMLYAPVTDRERASPLVHCYTTASKKLNGRYGPRFTGGVYGLMPASADQKNRFGAIVGYEQKLTKRIGLLVDWTSGENRLGYLNSALNFLTSHSSSLSAGYSVANHGRGKNALFVYYGTQF